jgi:CRISPR/Cas system endoribonuclease Cas6 (RAMP superfamily)
VGETDENLAMAIAVYLLGFSTYQGFTGAASILTDDADQDKMIKRIYEYAKYFTMK